MHAISVAHVSKRYGRGAKQVEALRDVSIEVPPGEIYGLLGRNGAGKTTLVKILLDIVRPSGGSTALLGRASRESAARQPVGYLPEDHRFPEYRTGEAALHFYAMLSGVPASVRDRRVPELLAMAGLETAGKRKVRSYSKGMKQRLGLAQALVHDPQILFLDEPTDGVDPVGRAEIRDVLVRVKQAGKTVFLNSHLLSEVEQICDRVGILERGELVREGSIAALTRSENLFTILTEPALDDAQLARLGALAVSVARVPQGIEVALRDAAQIDAIVDWLRSQRIGLRALAHKRVSLEEVFLSAVSEDGGAGGSP